MLNLVHILFMDLFVHTLFSCHNFYRLDMLFNPLNLIEDINILYHQICLFSKEHLYFRYLHNEVKTIRRFGSDFNYEYVHFYLSLFFKCTNEFYYQVYYSYKFFQFIKSIFITTFYNLYNYLSYINFLKVIIWNLIWINIYFVLYNHRVN